MKKRLDTEVNSSYTKFTPKYKLFFIFKSTRKKQKMPLIINNQMSGWPILSVRVPPQEMQKLESKIYRKGEKSRLIRALIFMYNKDKVPGIAEVLKTSI